MNLMTLAENVLAEVEQSDRVKVAELEAVKAATPRFHSEVGTMLHKVATDLRSEPVGVTYGDLNAFLQGQL